MDMCRCTAISEKLSGVCVYACMHLLPVQNGSESVDYLMKSLSFWVGREVDALH